MRLLFEGRIVGVRPCRRCRRDVEVTELAYTQLKRFSAELLRRGDRPLKDDECFLCDRCADAWKREHVERERRARRLLRDAMERLKSGGLDPVREREDTATVMRLHGDPVRWLRWLKSRRETDRGTNQRKGGV